MGGDGVLEGETSVEFDSGHDSETCLCGRVRGWVGTGCCGRGCGYAVVKVRGVCSGVRKLRCGCLRLDYKCSTDVCCRLDLEGIRQRKKKGVPSVAFDYILRLDT